MLRSSMAFIYDFQAMAKAAPSMLSHQGRKAKQQILYFLYCHANGIYSNPFNFFQLLKRCRFNVAFKKISVGATQRKRIVFYKVRAVFSSHFADYFLGYTHRFSNSYGFLKAPQIPALMARSKWALRYFPERRPCLPFQRRLSECVPALIF